MRCKKFYPKLPFISRCRREVIHHEPSYVKNNDASSHVTGKHLSCLCPAPKTAKRLFRLNTARRSFWRSFATTTSIKRKPTSGLSSRKNESDTIRTYVLFPRTSMHLLLNREVIVLESKGQRFETTGWPNPVFLRIHLATSAQYSQRHKRSRGATNMLSLSNKKMVCFSETYNN